MVVDPETDTTPPSSTPSVGWASFDSLLQEPLAGLIRAKARKLARRYPFTPHDWEDLAQDLLLKAVKVWPSIHAEGGNPAAFLARVLGNEASNLRRHHSAQRRRPHVKVVSLSRKHRNRRTGQTVELADLVTRAEHQARMGIATPTDQQRLETGWDVRQVVSSLPRAAQSLLEMLMDATKAEVARKQHLRRSTLESRLRRLGPGFAGN